MALHSESILHGHKACDHTRGLCIMYVWLVKREAKPWRVNSLCREKEGKSWKAIGGEIERERENSLINAHASFYYT